MKIDTAGNYKLKYTATDECGNKTVIERDLEAIEITYRTVLYTDGTFIINEKSSDIAKNVALHGEATNIYIPLDPNGRTATERYVFTDASHRPWDGQKNSIFRVEIGSKIQPESTQEWFSYLPNCVSIDLTNIDTSQTVNMSKMFAFSSACVAINLANMVTSNVTDMTSMFDYLYELESIDVSSFDTSKVEGMAAMFRNCKSLTNLDVSHFDTSRAKSIAGMFSDCTLLESIDVSNFNTSQVTSMGSLFAACKALTRLDLSSFDTRNVTSMRDMFWRCSALLELDISSFDTSSVTTVYRMFNGCSALKTIYASENFNVMHITAWGDYSQLFASMSSNLVGGAGTVWSSSNASSKAYARIDNPPSAPGYFTAKA